MSKIRDGQCWGDWRFVAANLTLVFEKQHKYEIDLETIRDSKELLDWIFHMRETKAWVTDQVMGNLIDAFRDLFFPPPFTGATGVFDPAKHLQQLLSEDK
jgi:hypothetical protein